MKNSLKLNYKLHGRFLNWGSSPKADWQVLFSLFIIVLIIGAVLGGALFTIVKNGSFGIESSTPRLPINQTLLHKTAIFYEQQKLDFAKYQSLPETTPDPSN